MTEYRELPGYPAYRFGSDGTVWSRLVRDYSRGNGVKYVLGSEWQQLCPAKSLGYAVVRLPGSRKLRKLHHLILEAFVCQRPKGLIGRHLDDNRDNNAVENLAWGTYVENAADAAKNGRLVTGEKHPNAKLTDEQVDEIRAVPHSRGISVRLAAQYRVSKSLVRQIRKGRHR